ncbi:hypothetical protein SDC9_107181 [bioreactor metagenome]|uniref:Uncharacterized protein n=1 Tax=bioreactor metagenome TaxID=1076179 RepID=A0A645B4D7_9ZZZZ
MKDEADLLAANERQLLVRAVGNVHAIQKISPGVRQIQTTHHVHQRGLAGTGRAADGDELPRSDVQRRVVERVHRLIAYIVGFKDVFQLQHDALLNCRRAYRRRASVHPCRRSEA